MAPSGRALPWTATVTTATIGGRRVLATPMLTGVGWVDFPVYRYTRDTARHSACATGACARAWPAMLTTGRPGIAGGVSRGQVTTLRTPEGTQVRYRGHLLYLFAFEGLAPTPSGIAAAGNGNGIKVNGGTFRLVTP